MWNLKLKSFRASDGFVLLMVLAFLVGFLCVAFMIQRVEGLESIYIKVDGSVVPSWTPISSVDNVTYTFNDTIIDSSIIVERDNIIIDGAGFTLQMTGHSIGLYTGIRIAGRENVTVRNLRIKAFMFGIEIAESSNATICGNNITANEYGIILFNSSKSNTIFGNYITDNNSCGIWLDGSSNQILYENVIDNNPFCFDISGSEPSHFVHSIDVSNLMNGKPVYYLVNQTGIVLNNATHPQVGYLALANCTNITVDGLSLADTGPLLMLAYTSNSTIMNNTMTNSTARNWYGVLLESSINNTFAGNNVTENNVGIWLSNSSGNIFSANNMKNNTGSGVLLRSSANNTFTGNIIANNEAGIGLEESYNNTLAGNNVTENQCGVFLTSSSDNSIYENNITENSGCGILLSYSFNNSFYHNNFLNNTEPVIFLAGSRPNFWDDGYPSGGNYWSGYSDTDMYSGPYQNETGSDVIWDHPYVINMENQDNYPTVPEYRTSIILLATMTLTFIIIATHKKKKEEQFAPK